MKRRKFIKTLPVVVAAVMVPAVQAAPFGLSPEAVALITAPCSDLMFFGNLADLPALGHGETLMIQFAASGGVTAM